MSNRYMTLSSFEAAADLSDKQYHIVRASGANTCNQASNATDLNVLGILQNKPDSGQNATIAGGGEETKVVAGASFSVNALLTTNGSGRAAAVASGANSMVIGRALVAAGADGDIVPVIPFHPYPFPGLAV